jgi:UDP-glucose 4-epimerase
MRFIFNSSAAIFGNPEYIPIDENHPKKSYQSLWQVLNRLLKQWTDQV